MIDNSQNSTSSDQVEAFRQVMAALEAARNQTLSENAYDYMQKMHRDGKLIFEYKGVKCSFTRRDEHGFPCFDCSNMEIVWELLNAFWKEYLAYWKSKEE